MIIKTGEKRLELDSITNLFNESYSDEDKKTSLIDRINYWCACRTDKQIFWIGYVVGFVGGAIIL